MFEHKRKSINLSTTLNWIWREKSLKQTLWTLVCPSRNPNLFPSGHKIVNAIVVMIQFEMWTFECIQCLKYSKEFSLIFKIPIRFWLFVDRNEYLLPDRINDKIWRISSYSSAKRMRHKGNWISRWNSEVDKMLTEYWIGFLLMFSLFYVSMIPIRITQHMQNWQT